LLWLGGCFGCHICGYSTLFYSGQGNREVFSLKIVPTNGQNLVPDGASQSLAL